MTFSEHCKAWKSVPQGIMDKLRIVNRRHRAKCSHIWCDATDFATAWLKADAKGRRTLRGMVERQYNIGE